MKATMKALVAVLTITSLGLVAGQASACGGKGGGYGGYGGYNNYHKKVYVKKVYVQPVHVHVEPIFHPQHCFAIVMPGDTWFTLSLREYGKPHLWKKIAIFNGLPLHAGLAPGMQLKLPVVHPNGVLIPSSAPAPIAFNGPAPGGLPQGGPIPQANFIPQGGPQGGFPQGGQFGPQANMIPANGAVGPQAGGLPQGAQFGPQGPAMNGPAMNSQPMNGSPNMFSGNGPLLPNAGAPNAIASAPSANVRTVTAETKLPNIAVGSILALDGQSLGNERGIVRLSINGLTLPVEVLEWNTVAAKIQLPQLELAGPMKAEIEVLRADGSLASKSAVELTPAASRLALGN
jgi:hypothetical protein